MKEKIIIKVTEQGDTEVSVECGQGESCKTLTETIEKALGKTIKDKPMADMYRESKVDAKNFA